MNFRLIALPILLFGAAASPLAAAESPQYIAIDGKLQIPGGIIEPGTYALSIEKRLSDRMVVRVANGNKGSEHFLMAVPSEGLSSGTDSGKGILLFNSSDNKQPQILRGWVCPTCAQGLEFVYATADARKITARTGQASLASGAGDPQLASIWKITPKHISRSHRVVGISSSILLHSVTSAPRPVMVAGLKQLPKTATNTYSLALWGFVLLVSAAMMRLLNLKAARQ